jgi:hypothetical protein
MSCCNNPTVATRSAKDQADIKTYCPLASGADTNMFMSYKSKVYEGYDDMQVQSGYASLGSAYSHNQFPVPTGGKSCIGYIKY